MPLQKEGGGKAVTHHIPAFSLKSGIGQDFVAWLQQSLGGGKSEKEAVQVARRAMKFFMNALQGGDKDTILQQDHVDCCLGCPDIIIKFEETLTVHWKLQATGALPYMKALRDVIDYRKCRGVTDNVLRRFALTEVYINRGIRNFAKKKKSDYRRNLDLETLIAKNSWATMADMETVIPHHSDRYHEVVKRCISNGKETNSSDLTFATRYIITFLFMRVKATRPMTFQYLTVDMFENSKSSNGFIDQTEFKTSDKYTFDTLVLSQDVITVIDSYVSNVRPLLYPKCPYLLVTGNGNQMSNLGAAFAILVFEAIGKSVNPTRYRQIVETESSARLCRDDQDIITKDQKHSSNVAKRIYKKMLSRDVATRGAECMEKMVGPARSEHTKGLAESLSKSSLCANVAEHGADVGGSPEQGGEQFATQLPQCLPATIVEIDVNPPVTSELPTTSVTTLSPTVLEGDGIDENDDKDEVVPIVDVVDVDNEVGGQFV